GKAYNSEDVAWSVEFPNINTIYLRGHSEAVGQFQVGCPNISADWVRFDFVFDDVYASVYTNGYAIVFNHGTENESTRYNVDGVGQVPYGLWVGGCNAYDYDNNTGGGEPSFGGRYDEVRIRNAVSTPAWVQAEYDTATDRGFFTYGAALQATSGGPGLTIFVR
ncbi:MAG: hypothetical protein ILO34_08480, partial [Kiritimatiellae bacterium]|nr:hypothetical protein [Kiritimatiellia bacterium]